MENRKHSILTILLINLSFLGILVVSTIVIGEWALRRVIPSWDHSGLFRLNSTPISYEMKPNLEIVREGVEIKTNSDGFRDSNFSGEPKPGQFLITVLGDSFVFGQGVPQSRTFPHLLENLLNQSHDTETFRVWNLGVSGYNTEQQAYLLRSFVLPRKPNWVVVGYNINDVEPIAIDPRSTPTEPESKPQFADRILHYFQYNLMIVQFLKARIGNLIRKINPHWYSSTYVQDTLDQYLTPHGGWNKVHQLLKQMKIECDERGVGFTVAVLPAMLDFRNYPFEKANNVILDFFRENGIDYIDTLSLFKGHNFMHFWVSPLDPHPNARAQEMFAKATADHLTREFTDHGLIRPADR